MEPSLLENVAHYIKEAPRNWVEAVYNDPNIRRQEVVGTVLPSLVASTVIVDVMTALGKIQGHTPAVILFNAFSIATTMLTINEGIKLRELAEISPRPSAATKQLSILAT